MHLTASLLIRSRSVTVKHAAATVLFGVEFNALRIGKLAAVVCQQYRKQCNKRVRAKLRIKVVKDVNN